MLAHRQVIEACFAASPQVRYVAAYLDGNLELRTRADLRALGSNESDTYEEIIVNPTLITLLTQRGNIDCGGFRHAVLRYGNFYALVCPVAEGHVTVSLEPDASLDALIEPMLETIRNALAGERPG